MISPSTQRTALAIDIGGTKMLAALVTGAKVIERTSLPTPGDANPDSWLGALDEETRSWRGRYELVGAAVTGIVENGIWSALNPETLHLPPNYPLTERLEHLFGCPAIAVNDAQIAAWGEYRFGAGRDKDCAFLTISTGIGGGLVLGGRLRSGLAGHFGQIRHTSVSDAPFETNAAGRWMARQPEALTRNIGAREIFAAAENDAPWARDLAETLAGRVAALCLNIQLTVDPDCIVIGGGIGLAPGFIDLIRKNFEELQPRLCPSLVAAALGGDAGIVGISDLAAFEMGSYEQRDESHENSEIT